MHVGICAILNPFCSSHSVCGVPQCDKSIAPSAFSVATPSPFFAASQSLIGRLEQALKEMADQQQRFALDKRALLAEKAQEVHLMVSVPCTIHAPDLSPLSPVLAKRVGRALFPRCAAIKPLHVFAFSPIQL